MHTAGRPVSPTIHPRTRPEAENIASKMRSTGDWFRHDGKNVEEPSQPPPRLQGHLAPEIAEKNKGEPDEWFQHDSKDHTESQPKARCPTEEAKQYHDKIYGKDEAWFKMEENRDYNSPKPKSRVTTVQGHECLEKLGKADTMNWYRHEHGQSEEYQPTPVKTRTGPLPYAGENKEKLRPQGTEPEWAKPKESGGEAILKEKPAERVKTADAKEYLDRNRTGSSNEWYGHTSTPDPSQVQSPRPASKAGMSDSENWFNHDSNKGYSSPQPKGHYQTESARVMMEKSRGKEMSSILAGDGFSSSDGNGRVKPEAKEIAKKNMEGMMSKYLDQEANANYNSARAGGRVVKQEAKDTAEKNKGVMIDAMQGHPASGPSEHSALRVKPEAQVNAQRNKGTMGSIIGGSGQIERSPAPRVKPEAMENAGRHKGQGMSDIMGGFGGMQVSGSSPAPRLHSASARASAQKNQGTVGDLFKMQ